MSELSRPELFTYQEVPVNKMAAVNFAHVPERKEDIIHKKVLHITHHT